MTAAAPAIEEIGTVLGLALAPAQVDQLTRFLGLLQQWNSTYNLSAVREPEAMRVQHLADCLAVVRPLERFAAAPGDRAAAAEGELPRTLLDVGSGGGLPGLLLAVALPHWRVTTIDTVAKKVAFVRQAAGALGLANVQAEQGHVESSRGPAFGVITARAFSSLAELVRVSRHRLAAPGVWMAMKGRLPDEEIAQLPPDIDAFHVEPLAVPGLQAERCLVWMRPRRDSAAP